MLIRLNWTLPKIIRLNPKTKTHNEKMRLEGFENKKTGGLTVQTIFSKWGKICSVRQWIGRCGEPLSLAF